MSSMVMEPVDKHTHRPMISRSRDVSCGALSNRGGRVTVFVVLIDGRPYGSTVQHAKAHVIPLQLAGRLNVVTNLQKKKKIKER